MFISEIKEISNYRNLSGKTIKFNGDVNFLIGENNVGKTNVLELLNTVISVGKFSEQDFTNILEPIRIKFTIRYEEEAVGFFEDYFDIDDNNCILRGRAVMSAFANGRPAKSNYISGVTPPNPCEPRLQSD